MCKRILLVTLVLFFGVAFLTGPASAANEEDHGKATKIDEDTEVYHCPVCDTDFLSMEEWEHYEELNHPDEIDMHKPVKMKLSESKKMKAKEDKIVYHCEVCDSDFITVKEWENYMKLNYPDVDTKKNLPNLKVKRDAKPEQTPKEIYFCEVCESGFLTKAEWEHYMKLNYPDVNLKEIEPKKVPYEVKKKEEK